MDCNPIERRHMNKRYKIIIRYTFMASCFIATFGCIFWYRFERKPVHTDFHSLPFSSWGLSARHVSGPGYEEDITVLGFIELVREVPNPKTVNWKLPLGFD